jgi:hypothetical protein
VPRVAHAIPVAVFLAGIEAGTRRVAPLGRAVVDGVRHTVIVGVVEEWPDEGSITCAVVPGRRPRIEHQNGLEREREDAKYRWRQRAALAEQQRSARIAFLQLDSVGRDQKGADREGQDSP